jgi:hypothetical protein
MAERTAPGLNPQLADLAFLVGAWEMELSNAAFLSQPTETVRSQVSYEWIENGAFLMLRMGENALWLIGRDEAQPLYTVLYFDARAVSRVYAMSLSDDTWTMWRDSAQFSQRFTGHISADRGTITAEWRKRSGQGAWEHDFDVTYRRLPETRGG